MRLTFENGNIEYREDYDEDSLFGKVTYIQRGTYIINNDNILQTITHRQDLGTKFNSLVELKEPMQSTIKYSVNGKKLTLDGCRNFGNLFTGITLELIRDKETLKISSIKKSEPAKKNSDGGGKSFNSADELKAYLDKQPANGPDKPIKISMTINDPMLNNVAKVLNSAGKYVSLNITGDALTTIPKNVFGHDSTEYSCQTLVSITIPNSVTSIGDWNFWFCNNLTSVTFQDGRTKILHIDSFTFPGDLIEKLKVGGLGGTYTRESGGNTWTKQ